MRQAFECREPAHLRPLRAATLEPVPIRPQRLPIRTLRLHRSKVGCRHEGRRSRRRPSRRRFEPSVTRGTFPYRAASLLVLPELRVAPEVAPPRAATAARRLETREFSVGAIIALHIAAPSLHRAEAAQARQSAHT